MNHQSDEPSNLSGYMLVSWYTIPHTVSVSPHTQAPPLQVRSLGTRLFWFTNKPPCTSYTTLTTHSNSVDFSTYVIAQVWYSVHIIIAVCIVHTSHNAWANDKYKSGKGMPCYSMCNLCASFLWLKFVLNKDLANVNFALLMRLLLNSNMFSLR